MLGDDVEQTPSRRATAGSSVFNEARLCQRHPEQADDEQSEIAADNQRMKYRRAVMDVQDHIRNEERDERHGELVADREIGRASKGRWRRSARNSTARWSRK